MAPAVVGPAPCAAASGWSRSAAEFAGQITEFVGDGRMGAEVRWGTT